MQEFIQFVREYVLKAIADQIAAGEASLNMIEADARFVRHFGEGWKVMTHQYNGQLHAYSVVDEQGLWSDYWRNTRVELYIVRDWMLDEHDMRDIPGLWLNFNPNIEYVEALRNGHGYKSDVPISLFVRALMAWGEKVESTWD